MQNGEDPADWKPMATIGNGVCEIRIRDDSGACRLMYIARFAEAVYVLHTFQKKTQATPGKDRVLAKARYQEVLAKRKAL